MDLILVTLTLLSYCLDAALLLVCGAATTLFYESVTCYCNCISVICRSFQRMLLITFTLKSLKLTRLGILYTEYLKVLNCSVGSSGPQDTRTFVLH